MDYRTISSAKSVIIVSIQLGKMGFCYIFLNKKNQLFSVIYFLLCVR